MRVYELIEILKTLDPNLEVVQSKDAEGNRFYPLDEVTRGHVTQDCDEFITDYSIDTDPDYPLEENPINAVCLWPN